VQNVTVFENPTSYLYFMLWLAFINQSTQFLLRKKQDSSVAQTGDKKIGLISLVSLGAVGILGIIIFNVQPARANMKTLSALRQLQVLPEYTANQATASTAAFVSTKQTIQEALLFSSPHIDDIRSDIGRAVAMMFEGQGQALPAQDKIELFNTIYPELQKNTDLHPLDIRNQLYLAQLAQFGANIMNNAAYVTSAESYLEDALKKSPRRQQLIYSLAFVKLQINKIPESIALLEGAIKDNSKISESYWRLAYVYSLSNKPDKMNEVFELAKKNGVTFSSQEQAIINQFVTQKNTTEVKTK
jgi:predicted Zn-dependent protease